MILSIIAFLISLIPAIGVCLWLRNRMPAAEDYKPACKRALIQGFCSVVLVLGCSAVFFIIEKIAFSPHFSPAFTSVYHAFFVLALAEELTKYLVFRRLMTRLRRDVTWLEAIAFMVIIGTAFGLIEDIPYALGASPVTMLVRGLTSGHIGLGFLMGLFYGKALSTQKPVYHVLSFGLPWLLHGSFDALLAEEVQTLGENNPPADVIITLAALLLAAADIALLITVFVFTGKKRHDPHYTTPLTIAAPEGKEVSE
ncbi:MAG: PrsW family intramembrane metalloprotease [Oscillospiraceae bacterium]|nr:PrsW family intramembrane metalloprotease [Oscillospiraceae bacterium]